ncbi:peptidase [Paenibacillus lautus]|uniref:Peptidase n=1 Tax=Paenibacillus lautus TaxID=1401 RepID=A0A385TJU2_PAELA|nr:peptidase [Paenibacillus lautus]AYB43906.1 peptidase [Paenibacillus lautus]
MNKIYKVLTTATILAMAALPAAANAQDVPPASVQTGQGSIVNQAKKSVPGTMGYITEYVNDKTGKWITVTGRGLGATDQQEIKLSISKDTKIIDAKGNKVQLQTIVDKNQAIKAFYGPNITKSLPPQGSALTIIVQDKGFAGIDGTIAEVTEQGILVEGTNLYNDGEETMLLHLDLKAKIIHADGSTLNASGLEAGMSIRAFYGPYVALSMPPQSSTNYIRVQAQAEEPVQEEPAGTNGIITDMADNKITVMGQALETGGVNYVILTVDENTEIVDAKGKPLTAEALKADLRIEAYYSQVMTLIYPARTHADKIVVSETTAPKIEGTVAASDRTTKDQLYINVGSDQSTENDVILNVTEDTQVIAGLSTESELKPGTKVVAYHSPIMTKSIPPITSAEVIIVQSGE